MSWMMRKQQMVWRDRTLEKPLNTSQRSRPETNVSTQPTCRHTVTFATMVCYAEVLFQSSFSLCRSTRCLRIMRHPTLWLGHGLRNGARRASRNVTVHRLGAYSQDLLFTAHLRDSRLYQAKGAKTCCAHHPCINRPILFGLLSQYTHNPSWSTMGLHFAHFFFFLFLFLFSSSFFLHFFSLSLSSSLLLSSSLFFSLLLTSSHFFSLLLTSSHFFSLLLTSSHFFSLLLTSSFSSTFFLLLFPLFFLLFLLRDATCAGSARIAERALPKNR